jgi:DNA repair photolyase
MKPYQLDLFASYQEKKNKIGHASITYYDASTLLTNGTGFMSDYDYTLNPFVGCSFACNYCYAAFFQDSDKAKENWGYWVKVKENALQLLKRFRKTPLIDKTIYLSSATDPYQPVERDLQLTRSLLEEFIKYHQVRLVVQTRGSLVTRDIDLFKQFRTIQVNMTVTTDSEDVRKAFESKCPSIKSRLGAIQEVHEAGVKTCITLSPLLPVEDPETFSETLLQTGVPRFAVTTFHADRGKFAAGTKDEALNLAKKMGWNDSKYHEAVRILRRRLSVPEGRSGFAPHWK